VESGFDYRGARFYDGDVVRFNSLDPLAMVFPGWSDYSYVFGNPLVFTDPTGKAPENDVTVDENGEVIEVVENDDPDRLFIETKDGKRNEVTLNDPDTDRVQLGSAEVGDKLVHFLTPENVNYIMKDAGVLSWHSQILGSVPEFYGTLYAATTSRGAALDFGYAVLVTQLLAAADKDATDGYSLGISADDDYSLWDVSGGFIFFTNNDEYKAYNVPDAGNFLWGHAMTKLGVSSQLMWLGSNSNEIGSGGDASADQTAIFRGAIHAHKYTDPISNWIGYSKVRPSWFHATGNSYGRNR